MAKLSDYKKRSMAGKADNVRSVIRRKRRKLSRMASKAARQSYKKEDEKQEMKNV